jgi:hypothetical protein
MVISCLSCYDRVGRGILFNYENVQKVLGYVELDYLADALKEYAENPQAVLGFIQAFNEAEGTE